ncbi:MAG TPA: hypothetical protein VGM85_03480 [Paraburkholderia sp.]|jgi:hypothetical protein
MNTLSIVADWVHAHERDHDGYQVFVDASEPLPPSRGRRRLTICRDGQYVDTHPGGDDRAAQNRGTYQFDGHVLLLHCSSGSRPLAYEVCLSGGKQLEIRRTDKGTSSKP